ncbi:transposase [Streptoalloteichus tenebrarius]|uniref:transposase n=1 Tax=Streptoalloteichus tenebrarius (strain ATCC 17920 / DSM 40477 / JCM 4838 / CBS 697.72 / NBRC 16177 / NCIMB 11028 / NRRL B-12390 / A12253. 1 / ISP 5477) TaxID=1933 RepID=UPI0035EAD2B1
MAYRERMGVPWREVPERFGLWQTLGERRSRWSADGTCGRLADQGRARADPARERGRGGCRWAPVCLRVHQHGAALSLWHGGVVASQDSALGSPLATASPPDQARPGTSRSG